jgi:hypothetical protein
LFPHFFLPRFFPSSFQRQKQIIWLPIRQLRRQSISPRGYWVFTLKWAAKIEADSHRGSNLTAPSLPAVTLMNAEGGR